MTDFTVSGKQLKLFRKMDLFVQADVVRRFGRLGFSLTVIQELISKGETLERAVNANLPSIMMAVGAIGDTDFEFIRNACLDIVEIQAGGVWVKLRPGGNALAWGDMQLMDLFMILAHVIKEVFLPFFANLSALSFAKEPADSQA